MSLLNPCRRTRKMFTKIFWLIFLPFSWLPFFNLLTLGTTFLPQPHLLLYIPCFNHKGLFWTCLCMFVYPFLSEGIDLFPFSSRHAPPSAFRENLPFAMKSDDCSQHNFLFGDRLLRCEAVLVFFVLESSNTRDTPFSSPSQDFLFWFLAPNLHGGSLGRDRPAGLATKPT